MNTFESLASKAPFGDGRVQLGFGFDVLHLPKDIVVGLYRKVRSLGVDLITLHSSRNAILGNK